MIPSISVIIPVYNAATYVRQAVESALDQPQTAEVILVEDGSPDSSLEICAALAEKYDRVRLYCHPGGENRGAGPSRNLGMEKSTGPYLAFLDADDFYLPGRFSTPLATLESDPGCDGVYEAVGSHFEDETGKERWLASSMAEVKITTMTHPVAPDDLFRSLLKGGLGHIHLNGLVIRRSVLARCGPMNDSIADTLHEDTDFILRLAAVGTLRPGRIDTPTSMRRVHAENRVSSPRPTELIYRDRMRANKATYRWCKRMGLSEQRRLVFRRMAAECIINQPGHQKMASEMSRKSARLATWALGDPEVLLERYFWSELAGSIWAALRHG